MSALTVHILAAVGIVPVAWLTVTKRLKIQPYKKKWEKRNSKRQK
jgi:hypothetical protein